MIKANIHHEKSLITKRPIIHKADIKISNTLHKNWKNLKVTDYPSWFDVLLDLLRQFFKKTIASS